MKPIFAAVIVAMLFCTVVGASAQGPAQSPGYKDGETWLYEFQRNRYEVTITGGKVVVFKLSPEGKVAAEDDRADLLSGFIAVERDDEELLQFPLAVGKKWTAQFDTGRLRLPKKGGSRTVKRSAESEVTALEQVTTPAGTFNAFKIERADSQSKAKQAGSKFFSEIIHYSPETRSVVKYEHEGGPRGPIRVQLLKFPPKE